MVEPQAVEQAAGSLEAPGRNVEAGKAAQIARAEATFAGQGMAGGRMQGHGIAPEGVKARSGRPAGGGRSSAASQSQASITRSLSNWIGRCTPMWS